MTDLHILNGDSISQLFAKSGISGEAFVWREVLCEGQAAEDLTSEEHWQYRLAYLKGTYSFFEQEKYDELKNGFIQLDLHSYNSIHLWFEYDLFCQINMMALLGWLASKGYSAERVFLICVGDHPAYDKLVGLGELSQTQFTALMADRQQVEEVDLTIAAALWKYWCTGEHHKLVETSLQLDQERFPYMTPALKAHLQRFPSVSTLLTEVENHILSLIAVKPQTKKAIVGQLLKRDNYYGFGDVQYFNILENLLPLLREEQGLLYPNISRVGRFPVEKPSNSNSQVSRHRFFGGASQTDYLYDETAQRLIRQEPT